MMRALWTAASGMKAQQYYVDVIANNLANVNTTSFKKDRVEFKDLLYETMDRARVLDGDSKPVNLQVGHGTNIVATTKDFAKGNFEKTDNPLDFAIDGEGFFTVLGPTGRTAYTRDGSFKISVTEDGNKLTTADGLQVLDQNGNEIFLDMDISKLSVSSSGDLSYTDETGSIVELGQAIGLVKFPNRFGLESIGKNLYYDNSATGQPVADTEMGDKSSIIQNFVESSNVQVVEEMVKLIAAQRAYEINSKAIQSSDEMLGIANNLRR